MSQVCPFFAKGKCYRGASCPLPHVVKPSSSGTSTVGGFNSLIEPSQFNSNISGLGGGSAVRNPFAPVIGQQGQSNQHSVGGFANFNDAFVPKSSQLQPSNVLNNRANNATFDHVQSAEISNPFAPITNNPLASGSSNIFAREQPQNNAAGGAERLRNPFTPTFAAQNPFTPILASPNINNSIGAKPFSNIFAAPAEGGNDRPFASPFGAAPLAHVAVNLSQPLRTDQETAKAEIPTRQSLFGTELQQPIVLSPPGIVARENKGLNIKYPSIMQWVLIAQIVQDPRDPCFIDEIKRLDRSGDLPLLPSLLHQIPT